LIDLKEESFWKIGDFAIHGQPHIVISK